MAFYGIMSPIKYNKELYAKHECEKLMADKT